jgi:VWFA-related protein
VDTLHSSFQNFGRVRAALGKFFENERATDAQYAVMALGRELKVVQDSTRDMRAAVAAVRASRFSDMIHDSEANNLAAAADQFTGLMRQYCAFCKCESAGQIRGKELGECSGSKGRVEAFLNSFAERTFTLNQAFLRQLNEVVRATATMPTSRTIIFISDGFNRFSGRELYAILLGYGPRDRDFEFNSRDTQPELEAVLKVATKSNVKFYTIDSRGLYTVMSVPGGGFAASSSPGPTNVQVDSRAQPNLSAGVPEGVTSRATSAARESTDVLAELAHQTGGIFFENSNDLLKGLRQAVADGREYYVLAYAPENSAADGTYRKIVVTVKDTSWRVNAKAGYWATGANGGPRNSTEPRP